MITRKRYLELHTQTLNDDAARQTMHQSYFAQFLNEQIINIVSRTFTPQELVDAYREDWHLNSIALERWDDLSREIYAQVDRKKMEQLGQIWSMSTATCISKAAAKMLITRYLGSPA